MTKQDRGQRALAERLHRRLPACVDFAAPICFACNDLAAAILGEHGVYLPDGRIALNRAQETLADFELERLQRIEAAARNWAKDHPTALDPDEDGCDTVATLRAALEAE